MKGVVLILGEERFLARRTLAEILARHPGADVSRYRGAETTLAAILDEARTPSLFGSERIVVVEEANAVMEAEALTALAAHAQQARAQSLLVLQCTRLDGRLEAGKALKRLARVIDCPAVPAARLPAFIVEHGAEAFGLSVQPAAARALVERVGEDLGLQHAALARLRDQIHPRTRLERDDVVESTAEHRSPILFEAANALEAGDLEAALAAIEAGFEAGLRIRQDLVSDPRAIAQILLSHLHGAYRKLLRFHMLGEGAAPKLGLSPAAARHFVRRAKGHRLPRLVQRHACFLEADRAMKHSADEPRRILAHLLVGLLG